MSGKRTVRYSSTKEIPRGKTNWKRVDSLTDQEIAKAVRADPDAPPLRSAEAWARAEIVLPMSKKPVTIRLDRDVIDWFKQRGQGYQTRINAVLRAYVEAQGSRTTRTG